MRHRIHGFSMAGENMRRKEYIPPHGSAGIVIITESAPYYAIHHSAIN
jgi:hypothetical protein